VNSVVDTIMLIAFVLFMIFIFQGYHASKLKEREELEEKNRDKESSKE